LWGSKIRNLAVGKQGKIPKSKCRRVTRKNGGKSEQKDGLGDWYNISKTGCGMDQLELGMKTEKKRNFNRKRRA